MKQFKTILDEIAEMFDKEEPGAHSYHLSSISQDKIDFGVPNINKLFKVGSYDTPQNNIIDNLNKTPVAGKQQDIPAPVKNVKKQLNLPASSTIQSAAYWPKKEYLLVSFKSGATYSYNNVPMLTVQLWQNVSSAGSWFYRNIRTSYPYQKLG